LIVKNLSFGVIQESSSSQTSCWPTRSRAGAGISARWSSQGTSSSSGWSGAAATSRSSRRNASPASAVLPCSILLRVIDRVFIVALLHVLLTRRFKGSWSSLVT
jgi:hypothetical protein